MCIQISKYLRHTARRCPAAPTNTLSTLSRSRHGRCFTRRATQRHCVPQIDNGLMLFASCTVFGALRVYTHARRSSHYLSAKSTSHTTLKNANYLTTSLSVKKHHTSHETHTTPPSKYHLSRHNTTTSWWKYPLPTQSLILAVMTSHVVLRGY